jgi:hypothetical protein
VLLLLLSLLLLLLLLLLLRQCACAYRWPLRRMCAMRVLHDVACTCCAPVAAEEALFAGALGGVSAVELIALPTSADAPFEFDWFCSDEPIEGYHGCVLSVPVRTTIDLTKYRCMQLLRPRDEQTSPDDVSISFTSGVDGDGGGRAPSHAHCVLWTNTDLVLSPEQLPTHPAAMSSWKWVVPGDGRVEAGAEKIIVPARTNAFDLAMEYKFIINTAGGAWRCCVGSEWVGGWVGEDFPCFRGRYLLLCSIALGCYRCRCCSQRRVC